MAKSQLDLPVHSKTPRPQSPFSRLSIWVVLVCGVALVSLSGCVKAPTAYLIHTEGEQNPDALCPIVTKLDPSSYLYNNETLNKILHDQSFRNASVAALQAAIRVPTQIYDGMLVPEGKDAPLEDSWTHFETFHEYLKDTFPLVHKSLTLEKVNRFGLVYTWEGSDTRKKPILLTAHYDVVPVQEETVNQWTYPPFDGAYDGKYVYGRGASDCKDLLVGLMETVELLLQEGKFSPKRTIILAFGYDEEAAGMGAERISAHLLQKYGSSSFFQIIDEGNSGYEEVAGNKYILPAVGEKGHLNSIIELYTPGGHSSVPPKHTSIGLLAKVISDIEDEEFAGVLSNANPVLSHLQCVAEHSTEIDPKLRSTILRAHIDKAANQALLDVLGKDPYTKYTVTTSQAVDVISGGVKSNALPEHASVLINHRIAVEESVATTKNKVVAQLHAFAERYDLGLVSDGEVLLDKTANGYFEYTANEPLEPAPLTPVGDEVWDVFGGSLRYLYEDLLSPGSNETYIFAPYISTGNTDTKSYWDLSRNIFRYSPGAPEKGSNIHSVDERLVFDGHLQIIAFYYFYLQVIDGLVDPGLNAFA